MPQSRRKGRVWVDRRNDRPHPNHAAGIEHLQSNLLSWRKIPLCACRNQPPDTDARPSPEFKQSSRRREIYIARLTDVVLPAARLTGSDAAYADFLKADHSEANFSQSNLMGANLKGANLSHVDFADANLSYADLRGADLTGAQMEGTNLANTVWTDGSVCEPRSVGSCLTR